MIVKLRFPTMIDAQESSLTLTPELWIERWQYVLREREESVAKEYLELFRLYSEIDKETNNG